MAEFFFTLKTLCFTFVLVVLMQLQISGQSLEDKIFEFTANSSVVSELEQVAKGAIVLTQNIFAKFAVNFGMQESAPDLIDENAPGRRSLMPQIKRSQAYLSDLSDKAKASIRSKVDSAQNSIENAENEQQGHADYIEE